jgi:multisubunit Na+/H+ antiporter MnhF subunit
MHETLNLAALWVAGLADAILWLGILLLAISMAVGCALLISYPEVADRAIAFDLVMVHMVGLIALSAIVLEYPLLIDTLIVVAVLGFLGTVTIARYLERGVAPDGGALPVRQPEHDGNAGKREVLP